jgi:hypothetical protein
LRTTARLIASLTLAAASGPAPAHDRLAPASAASGGDARGVLPARPPEGPVSREEATGLWRAARWGMTVEELLKAFPGEARRLDPEIKLADGNVVAAAIEEHSVAGRPFRVRFVFEGAKLAIVSLRTPEGSYADDKAYDELRAHLRGRLGEPSYGVTEKPFVEQRQTRWALREGVVDLKAIPGTVVLMYSPPPAPSR